MVTGSILPRLCSCLKRFLFYIPKRNHSDFPPSVRAPFHAFVPTLSDRPVASGPDTSEQTRSTERSEFVTDIQDLRALFMSNNPISLQRTSRVGQ
jgi:hypothetical protein